jgi:hypothetical protein
MKKIIDDNLLAIFNIMFKNREDWQYVTDKQKETFFFIISRHMSKKYPKQAQLLNLKTINNILALDLWFHFVESEPYPKWFWSKGEKSEKSDISEKDFKLLLIKLRIKKEDLEYLIDKHPEFIKEELKFYKEIEKGLK